MIGASQCRVIAENGLGLTSICLAIHLDRLHKPRHSLTISILITITTSKHERQHHDYTGCTSPAIANFIHISVDNSLDL